MPRSFPGRGHRYDVVVVGAGAAGSEAAWRLATAGSDVLLVTTSLDTVYAAPADRVPFEPEPATLGAAVEDELPRSADGTVGAWQLHSAVKYRLEAQDGLHLLQSNADSLVVRDGEVEGVETWEGLPRFGGAVLLCVGPFLRARLRVADAHERAGRPGEMAYDDLADDLDRHRLPLLPARIEGGGSGAPQWSVEFVRLADEATDGVAVPALTGLYAAGICARGPLSYRDAVREGAAAARAVGA